MPRPLSTERLLELKKSGDLDTSLMAAELLHLRPLVETSKEEILGHLSKILEHSKENAIGLAKFGVPAADEARCRALAALHLQDAIMLMELDLQEAVLEGWEQRNRTLLARAEALLQEANQKE